MRLSFAGGNFRQPGNLHANLMAQLDGIAEQAGLSSRHDTAPERFGHLIRALSARVGAPVVVLVDEYDKPILDALEDISGGSGQSTQPVGLQVLDSIRIARTAPSLRPRRHHLSATGRPSHPGRGTC